jgi:hypothetical protein
MTESELQKHVLNALEKAGIFAWRNNTGATRLGGEIFILWIPRVS